VEEKKSRIEMLRQEGWQRQFVANEPRLSEAVKLYREVGFDVLLEPLPEKGECESCSGEDEDEKECRICFEGFEDQYKIIYTRPKNHQKGA
jgi:hypothetical protein